MKKVVMKEVVKLLDAGIIYPISDNKWISPTQVVPKKFGLTVVENAAGELIPQCTTIGWRVCIDYRKLNSHTRKDHFPLPFIDQILERLAGQSNYCFLDGYSGYNQVALTLKTRRWRCSHVPLALLLTDACPLAYAMHPPPSKDV
jgi:hypothetical protein